MQRPSQQEAIFSASLAALYQDRTLWSGLFTAIPKKDTEPSAFPALLSPTHREPEEGRGKSIPLPDSRLHSDVESSTEVWVIHLFTIYRGARATVYMQRPEDNSQEPALSFHYMGPGD